MAGGGRRTAIRGLVGLAAAAVAFSASTVVSLAAGSPLSLTVNVGYHNSVKLGRWMPVSVDITNSGADIQGTLEVQASSSLGAGPPMGNAIYEAPVSLAAGTTKHFRTYVIQDYPGTITARVVQNGHDVASQQAVAPNTVSGLAAGIVSDQATTLDGLGSVRPGGVQPLVVHLAPADLSDSVPVLRAFDLIAIDDFATDTLTAAQRTALDDYVLQGGALLLGTGGAWHKTLAGLPAALVPMHVTGTRVLHAVTALDGAQNVEVATGTLDAAAAPWLAEGADPLLVEAGVGKGMVMMAAFDWNDGAVADKTTLVRQTLVRMTYGSISSPVSAGPAVGKFAVGGTASIAAKGGALSGVLGNVPALALPAWWLIGALVFVYVLLVGPINYFVLSAIGRRALAWLTIPTIAIVASAGAYGTGVVTKGTSVLANEVSVIQVLPGSGRAYQEEYTGIITPTRGDYEIGVGGTRTLVSPIYYYSGSIADPNFGAMRIDTVTSGVTLPGMAAFTLRGFAGEGVLASAPDVTGQAQVSGGQIVGTVRNSSSIQFTDGAVITGGGYQKLGELRPGAGATFSVQQSTGFGNGPPVALTIYPSNFGIGAAPNNTSDVEREMETRNAVLGTLIPNAYGGYPPNGQPIVVLWTHQPFQNVTINGAHPRTYIESAVVLTLPIQQVGAGALPAGVVPGRIIDIDADTNPGPPGMLLAQSGSVTYSFSPRLASGTHLTGVTINDNNPYGGKILLGPNGNSASAKAQVWDWTQSRWIDVVDQGSGSTTVPDAAVNPTSGEVRLRLSSTGQFTTGWLSLSGAVS